MFKALRCCHCDDIVKARLTDGTEIYPHRKDLKDLRFWVCENCDNYVGCHRDSTDPLGSIPGPMLRQARRRVHKVLDPLWKERHFTRTELYKIISDYVGYKFHTAEITTVREANEIRKFINGIRESKMAEGVGRKARKRRGSGVRDMRAQHRNKSSDRKPRTEGD